MELKTRNVNTAFKTLVETFQNDGFIPTTNDGAPIVRRDSRNGPVLMIDKPVLITYERPLERVLFNEARDANPFLHLYHSLWMLAGRNDVTPLAFYASNMANYSDDGKTLNGAYGYRWRRGGKTAFWKEKMGGAEDGKREFVCLATRDQLDAVVYHLSRNLESRRAVLQMWDVDGDLSKIGDTGPKPGGPVSKDVCCNLNVMFSLKTDPDCPTCLGKWTLQAAIRFDEKPPSEGGVCPNRGGDPSKIFLPRRRLDMTVTNRSNDMIWGMLGEDYCTFSFLQEYVAARLGVEVGRYYHFTNNLHVYESNWKPKEWLAEYDRMKGNHSHDGYEAEGEIELMKTVSLVANSERFKRELPVFVEHYSGEKNGREQEIAWEEPFFATVAGPMLTAYAHRKAGDLERAIEVCESVASADWRLAGIRWLRRRLERRRAKK